MCMWCRYKKRNNINTKKHTPNRLSVTISVNIILGQQSKSIIKGEKHPICNINMTRGSPSCGNHICIYICIYIRQQSSF